MDNNLKKVAMLQKMALNGGDVAFTAAAALVAASFFGGFAGGYATGKFTEPGQYDIDNLSKEYELARLHRDNQTQQIMAEREQAERRMRGIRPKSMRIG